MLVVLYWGFNGKLVHYLFFINVPIAIVSIILGYFKMNETRADPTGKMDRSRNEHPLIFIDPGAMYGITNIETDFWGQCDLTDSILELYYSGELLRSHILIGYNRASTKSERWRPGITCSLIEHNRTFVDTVVGALSGALDSLEWFLYQPSLSKFRYSSRASGYWMTPLALASGVGGRP